MERIHIFVDARNSRHNQRLIAFERRLQERGIPAARMADMTCPIGLPGINDKAPAVIAVSVAAQLMQVWEAAALAVPVEIGAKMSASAQTVLSETQTTCTN